MLAAADQIVDGARLDKRQPDRLTAGGRGKGHSVTQRRIVLHVVEFGEALRRPGEPRVGNDIANPLTVDKDLPVVVERVEKLLAGSDGHASLAFKHGLLRKRALFAKAASRF